MNGFMSVHAQANATEVLSDERGKGPHYKKWSHREECLTEVRAMFGDTVPQIAARLAEEGYSRSHKSIVLMLRKLGVSAKGGAQVLVPFK